MTVPSIKVEGADKLHKALKQFADGTNDLKAAHKAAAQIVEKDAEPRARRKTGRMAGSVRSSGQAKQGVVRAGFASTPWVPVQHFGWAGHNISPNPFLYDALDARADAVVSEYETQVDDLARKHDLI